MISNNYREIWKSIPWRKLRKELFRLQVRVWKAMRVGDKPKVKNLQKLILRSRAARLLAIRQVTQLNAGQKTAGIDGKAKLTFRERLELDQQLAKSAFRWKHSGLREIPIPKKDGTTRILKVPTIADRAWQCLVKYALEPAHEATFKARSYGFRTGRSAYDAQRYLSQKLNSKVKGIEKRILELDIEKCFDRINHNKLMEEVVAPQSVKLGIWKCLKAGVNPEFPEQGTPQGGVVSPLLANIALNGVEKIGEYYSGGEMRPKCVRYADDMVFILKPEDDATELRQNIDQFLAKRGLNVKESKTRLVRSTDGFDFLGWHFSVKPNGKFLCVPSEDNYQEFRRKVKNIVNSSNYGAEDKAKKLTPIIRGWLNYHKYCDLNGFTGRLWQLDHSIFRTFLKEKNMNRYKAERLAKQAFPQPGYKVNGFVMVKGEYSPFNGDVVYWSKRKSKLYEGATAKALIKQHHSCGYCGLKFVDDERIHLHHVDGNHDNWRPKNLLAVHESCHDYIHMSQTS